LKMDRIIEELSKWLHWIGVHISLPLLVVLLSVDVSLRYVFNSPLQWGSELSALILLIVFFASFPQVTRSQGHIRIDMLYRLMRPMAKRMSDALTGLSGLTFSLLLTYQSLKSVIEMYRWQERAEMIDLPYWPFVSFVGLCGLIVSFQFAVQIAKALNPHSPEGNG
jgi:TRAP-type transport system small permease protein